MSTVLWCRAPAVGIYEELKWPPVTDVHAEVSQRVPLTPSNKFYFILFYYYCLIGFKKGRFGSCDLIGLAGGSKSIKIIYFLFFVIISLFIVFVLFVHVFF